MSIAEQPESLLQAITGQFHAEILAYIQGKVRDTTTAEDLAQETFNKVGRALAKGTTPEHFRGWLYQIARNTIVDFFTESQRFVPLEDSVVDREVSKPGAADFDDGEFRKNLFSYTLKVIETFPSEDREVLTLTEIDGLSREELAAELKISLTAAKSRVHRARAKLRKTVEECCRLVTDPYGRVIDWRKRSHRNREQEQRKSIVAAKPHKSVTRTLN
jgi:RNA polymerase sigma-70 factor, ECF subfamily